MYYIAIADSNIQLYFDTANISLPPSQISKYLRHYSRPGFRILGPLPVGQSLSDFDKWAPEVKTSSNQAESNQSIREKGLGRKADARYRGLTTRVRGTQIK